MDTILKAIGATHRFRDPLYGFIYLTDYELKIIDTPIYQRLRRIHQLALTKYVYPTAEHTRFVHSLGVVHSATAIFAGVLSNKRTEFNDAQKIHFATLLRFAALLHDIGHIPFSHAAEKFWLNGLSHEDISQYIITSYEPICAAIDDAGVVPDHVASLLSKRFKAKHRLLHEIISGQLDADRADYLLRDSYCCGVKYGEYDFNRYIKIFSTKGDGDGFRLAVEEKDMYVAEAFLIARYHYNLQVPYHRTRSGYDCILRKFLSLHKNENFFEINEYGKIKTLDIDYFTYLDDYTLFQRFKDEAKKGDMWAKFLLREGHLKTLIDTTSSASGGGQDLFKNAVTALKDGGLEEEKDIFIQEQKIELIKQQSNGTSDDTKSGDTILVLYSNSYDREETAIDICEHSWIFKQLKTTPPRVLRVFTTPEQYERARRIVARVSRDIKE